MQKDYIRNFFMDINKVLMDLEKYICADNILYTENSLNELEKRVRVFRKKIKAGFKDLITGKKQEEYLKSDEL